MSRQNGYVKPIDWIQTQIIIPDYTSPASVMFNTELILFPQILDFPSTSLYAWRGFFVEVLSKLNRTFPI